MSVKAFKMVIHTRDYTMKQSDKWKLHKEALEQAKTPEEIVEVAAQTNYLCLQTKERYDWEYWNELQIGDAVREIEIFLQIEAEEQRLEDFLFFCNHGYYPDDLTS